MATAVNSRRLMTRQLFIVLILVAGCLGACTRGVALPDTVQDSARRAYYSGMRELASSNFLRATQQFNRVARTPRAMRYAALARLRIADALFLQERYEEAIEVYRAFASQYASDPNLDYARFRIAASYAKRLPSEWFASPPAAEIDQSVTHEAERELKAFLKTFPTSRFASDARMLLQQAQRMLYDHELYVVDFYERRTKWKAVAWRLEHVLKLFPTLSMTPEHVWRMAEAYDKIDDKSSALRAYGLYLERFPKAEQRDAATDRLARLKAALEQPEMNPDTKQGEDPSEG